MKKTRLIVSILYFKLAVDRAHSPSDNDSAFGDCNSMLSSESTQSRSGNGSAESSRASLTTPSPTQVRSAVFYSYLFLL